jgi:hypothetical protein
MLEPTKPRKKSYLLTLLMVLFVVGLLFAAYLWIALNWSYSVGNRAGFMQKFSEKGWLCKTWEGELSLIAIPGAAPEKFFFSVRDPAVAKQVEAAMGKRISLEYQQHIGLPTSCFGETQYYVVGVKEVISQNSGRDLLPGG